MQKTFQRIPELVEQLPTDLLAHIGHTEHINRDPTCTFTRQSIIAVLWGKISIATLVILYLIKFTVELSCADKRAVAQHSPPNRHFGLGMRFVFWCQSGLIGIGDRFLDSLAYRLSERFCLVCSQK